MNSMLRQHHLRLSELKSYLRTFEKNKPVSPADWSTQESQLFHPGYLVFCLEPVATPAGLSSFSKRGEDLGGETFRVKDLCVVISKDEGKCTVINITASAYEMRVLDSLLLEKASKAILDGRDFNYLAARPTNELSVEQLKSLYQTGAKYAQGGSRRSLTMEGSTLEEPTAALLNQLNCKLTPQANKQVVEIGSICHMIFTPDVRQDDRNKIILKANFSPIKEEELAILGLAVEHGIAPPVQAQPAAQAVAFNPLDALTPVAETPIAEVPFKGFAPEPAEPTKSSGFAPEPAEPTKFPGFAPEPAEQSSLLPKPKTRGFAPETESPAAPMAFTQLPQQAFEGQAPGWLSAPPAPGSFNESSASPSTPFDQVPLPEATIPAVSFDTMSFLHPTLPALEQAANQLAASQPDASAATFTPESKPVETAETISSKAAPWYVLSHGREEVKATTVATPPKEDFSQQFFQDYQAGLAGEKAQDYARELAQKEQAIKEEFERGKAARLREHFEETPYSAYIDDLAATPAPGLPPEPDFNSSIFDAAARGTLETNPEAKVPLKEEPVAPLELPNSWLSGFSPAKPAADANAEKLEPFKVDPFKADPFAEMLVAGGELPTVESPVPEVLSTQAANVLPVEAFSQEVLEAQTPVNMELPTAQAEASAAFAVEAPVSFDFQTTQAPAQAEATAAFAVEAPVSFDFQTTQAPAQAEATAAFEIEAPVSYQEPACEVTANLEDSHLATPDAPAKTSSGVNLSWLEPEEEELKASEEAESVSSPATIDQLWAQAAPEEALKEVPTELPPTQPEAISFFENLSNQSPALHEGARTEGSPEAVPTSLANLEEEEQEKPSPRVRPRDYSRPPLRPGRAVDEPQPAPEPELPAAAAVVSEPELPTAPAVVSESELPSIAAVVSEPELPTAATVVSEPELPTAATVVSEPELPTAATVVSEPELPTAAALVSEPELPTAATVVSEPELPAAASALGSEPELPPAPAALVSEPASPSNLPPSMTLAASKFTSQKPESTASKTFGQDDRLMMNEMNSLMSKLEQQVAKAANKLGSRAEELRKRLGEVVESLVKEANAIEKDAENTLNRLSHERRTRLESVAREVEESTVTQAESCLQSLEAVGDIGLTRIKQEEQTLNEGILKASNDFKSRLEISNKNAQERLDSLIAGRNQELTNLKDSILMQLSENHQAYQAKVSQRFDRFKERMNHETTSINNSLNRNMRSMMEEIENSLDRACEKLRSTKSDLEQVITHTVAVAEMAIAQKTKHNLSEQLLPRLNEQKEIIRTKIAEMSRELEDEGQNGLQKETERIDRAISLAKDNLKRVSEECLGEFESVSYSLKAGLEDTFKQASAELTDKISEIQDTLKNTEARMAKAEQSLRNLAESSSVDSEPEINQERNQALNTLANLKQVAGRDLAQSIEGKITSLEKISEDLYSELTNQRLERTSQIRDSAEASLERVRQALNHALQAIESAKERHMD